MNQTVRTFLSFTILFLLTACGRSPDSTPVPVVPGATIQAPSEQGTVLPDEGLPTFTPTLFALLPFSLTTAELHAHLDPFTDPQCELPCYLNLSPGQSDLQDTLGFYQILGIGVEDFIPGDFQVVQETSTGRLRAFLTKTSDIAQNNSDNIDAPLVNIAIENNVVQRYDVQWGYSPEYITPILVTQQLGNPDSFQIGLNYSRDPDQPTYIVQFAYHYDTGEQLLFTFIGLISNVSGEDQVCLSTDTIEITIFGGYVAGVTLPDDFPDATYLLPTNKAVSLDYSAFAEAINTGACIDIPDAS